MDWAVFPKSGHLLSATKLAKQEIKLFFGGVRKLHRQCIWVSYCISNCRNRSSAVAGGVESPESTPFYQLFVYARWFLDHGSLVAGQRNTLTGGDDSKVILILTGHRWLMSVLDVQQKTTQISIEMK